MTQRHRAGRGPCNRLRVTDMSSIMCISLGSSGPLDLVKCRVNCIKYDVTVSHSEAL